HMRASTFAPAAEPLRIFAKGGISVLNSSCSVQGGLTMTMPDPASRPAAGTSDNRSSARSTFAIPPLASRRAKAATSRSSLIGYQTAYNPVGHLRYADISLSANDAN